MVKTRVKRSPYLAESHSKMEMSVLFCQIETISGRENGKLRVSNVLPNTCTAI